MRQRQQQPIWFPSISSQLSSTSHHMEPTGLSCYTSYLSLGVHSTTPKNIQMVEMPVRVRGEKEIKTYTLHHLFWEDWVWNICYGFPFISWKYSWLVKKCLKVQIYTHLHENGWLRKEVTTMHPIKLIQEYSWFLVYTLGWYSSI